jgi:predicted RND superfamily exporter protein
MTNLTTAAGFATFIITNSELLKEFGIISSLSIVALFFFMSYHHSNLLQLSTCSKKAPETFESQLHKSSWLDRKMVNTIDDMSIL